MSATDHKQPAIPARVQAAIDYLEHCRWLSEQCDTSIPARTLTTLEQSVADAALRLLSSYFLGEMDFGDMPPYEARDRNEPDDGASELVPSRV